MSSLDSFHIWWLKIRRNVEALIRKLYSAADGYEFGVCDRVTSALGEIGEPAVEPLIAMLKDAIRRFTESTSERRRRWATEALGEIGEPAVTPLIAMLEDEDCRWRGEPAQALGMIGDIRAVEPLIATLKNKSLFARGAAAEALGKLGDVRGVEPLIVALKDKIDDVRRAAAESLGELGDPRAVEPLLTALAEEREKVRRAAARGLVQLYHDGRLGELDRQRILGAKNVISMPHTDHIPSSDCVVHTDRGAGVSF